MPHKGPESKFRTEVCKGLKKCNAKIINNVQYMGETKSGQILSPEPGVSDIILIHPYCGIVFLEFKAENGKLTPVQRRFLEEVNMRVPYSALIVREECNGKNLGQLECFDGKTIYGIFNTGLELINLIKMFRG